MKSAHQYKSMFRYTTIRINLKTFIDYFNGHFNINEYFISDKMYLYYFFFILSPSQKRIFIHIISFSLVFNRSYTHKKLCTLHFINYIR